VKTAVETSKLPLNVKLALRLQKLIAWLTLPIWFVLSTAIMRFFYGYKIKNLKQFRQNFKHLLKNNSQPIVICANHLTKVDSLIIIWALGSLGFYIGQFKKFAWNLPEKERYFHSIFLRLFCYIGCCIPVSRGGDRKEVNQSLDKILFLVADQHLTLIFPEGKRGEKVRIDKTDYSYGVGRIIQRTAHCQVLCIYMRGRHQEQKSDYPVRGEEFYIKANMIQPSSDLSGMRQIRALSSEVILKLSEMESEYFDYRWE
jgi:1-acyl-sn-glycerol-3-phosphate acyltransferase